MAIGGGWVGSNAVNETGQRWMSQAASVVRLGTPFWMSQLVGRSKFDFELYIGQADRDQRLWRGWRPDWGMGNKNFGNPIGYNMTSLYALNGPESAVMRIDGTPNRNFLFQADDGTRWQFNKVSDIAYSCTDGSGFYRWISGRIGQNIGFLHIG